MSYDRVFQVRNRVIRREARQPRQREEFQWKAKPRRENRRHRFPLKRSTIRVIETQRERIGSLPEPFELEARRMRETEAAGLARNGAR